MLYWLAKSNTKCITTVTDDASKVDYPKLFTAYCRSVAAVDGTHVK